MNPAIKQMEYPERAELPHSGKANLLHVAEGESAIRPWPAK
jgi:hypothetical protein